MKKMGIPVYVNKPVRLEDVPRAMRHFGCLAGTQALAEQTAQQFAKQLSALHAQHAGMRPVRVFYQIGPYSLMTVNRQSWINQAIELCGGMNVFADASVIAAEVSLEAIIAARPQVIIAASLNNVWQQRWQHFPTIQAVHDGLLFTLPPDLIDRAGPAYARRYCPYLRKYRSYPGKTVSLIKPSIS